MFLANKRDMRSNAFSCDRYVSASHAMMSIFAEPLSICATRVRLAPAMSLPIVERLENADNRCIIGSDSDSGFVARHPLNASSPRRTAPVQMFPVKARIIKIKRINPSPPLGQYPQPELYGQAGSAPTKSRIRMINRMVPMISPFLNYVRQREEFWMS
jgi:hypothetical protein